VTDAILEFRQLGKKIGNDGGELLFQGLSAAIRKPESIALMGASGQGKSTLLRILAGLEPMDEGELLLHGQSLASMDMRRWRREVCYVAQQAVMLPGNVAFNLQTVSRLHGTAFDAVLAKRLMEQFGLGHIDWKKPAEELSGGEKQRVALIRSCMMRSSILLLDEVTASLDVDNSRLVEEMLMARHREDGTVLIWITHQPEQALRIAKRSWTLAGGKLTDGVVAVQHTESVESL
jgi:putative ABC transport system ATP-binding protein